MRRLLSTFPAVEGWSRAWFAAIYDRHRAAGNTHQHATRILARAWLRVIWRCWHDHTAYDPTRHGGNKPFHTPTDDVDKTAA